MPLAALDKNELPLPLFIKADDIEYGMRLGKKLVFVNGISVWHHAFDEKPAPYLSYYVLRNVFIVDAIIIKRFLALKLSFRMALLLGKRLFTAPWSIEFIYQAVDDFLKGPDFLLELDGEKMNGQVRAMQKELEKKHKGGLYYWLTVPWKFLAISFMLFAKEKQLYDYGRRRLELVSWDSWCKRLGL